MRRRRGTLGSWILMIVLFVGALALIFYILLLRAQSLSRMEDQRTQAPQSQIEVFAERSQAVIYLFGTDGQRSTPAPHVLVVGA